MEKGKPIYEELGMSKEEYIRIQRELMRRIFTNASTKVGFARELVRDIQCGKYTMEDVIIALLNCLETTGRLMQVIADASQNSLRITKSMLTMLDSSIEKLEADAGSIAYQIETIGTNDCGAVDRLEPVYNDMKKLVEDIVRIGSIVAKTIKAVESEAEKIIESIEQEIDRIGGE